MTPREYCAEQAAPAGSSLYYAAMFHAPAERRALYACFAFMEEVRRDLASAMDPTPAARRLMWWREELGTARMAASVHPLLVELRALPVPHTGIGACLEPCLVAGLEELSGWRPESTADWRSHCHALNAGVWQLASRSCAYPVELETSGRIGALAALSGQMQHLRELAPRTSAGRCPLPRAVLESHGLDPRAGTALLTHPELPRAVLAILSELRADLRRYAGPDAASFRGLPLFCRVLHLCNLRLCEQLLRQPGSLLTDRVMLTPLRKLWIAWRTHRRGAGT